MNIDDFKGKWSFITIRFHETDLEMFDHFCKNHFLPYISSNQYYLAGIEHPLSSERHLHAIIKNTTLRDNDKVKTKLSNMINSKKNLIYNTITANALDCKSVKANSDKRTTQSEEISRTIGYIVKSGNTDISTNIPQEDIEYGRKEYLINMKDPVCQVDHILQYKNIAKGNLLLYLYDAHIKHKDIPIQYLPSYMVKYMNVSFIAVKSLLSYALLELKLKIGSNHEQIHLQTEEDYTNMEGLPFTYAHDNLKYLQEQLEIEKFKNEQNLLKIEKLEFENEKLQDALTTQKIKNKNKKI
jgi:S-adenosylmethionine hydrolase